MVNVYDFMKDLPPEKRLSVNDLLFAEYKCPLSETRFDMWTHHNYFVYVIKGKKKWFAGDHEVLAQAGDCIFVKKGAHSIYQYFDDEFCSLFMFVPDQFIRDTLLGKQVNFNVLDDKTDSSPILRVQTDDVLKTYFYSFLSYISKTGSPDKKLAELKFRELIMIVASGSGNKSISGYFLTLLDTTRPSLQSVMESNFTYPMKLEEYARLSGRSLSTFKRDFKEIYGTTPGKWLRQKRLDYGRYLLEQTDKSVTEVMLDCGFKNNSHFSRAFKEQFDTTPSNIK
jgi:AraC-like DNA-binding protein